VRPLELERERKQRQKELHQEESARRRLLKQARKDAKKAKADDTAAKGNEKKDPSEGSHRAEVPAEYSSEFSGSRGVRTPDSSTPNSSASSNSLSDRLNDSLNSSDCPNVEGRHRMIPQIPIPLDNPPEDQLPQSSEGIVKRRRSENKQTEFLKLRT
jgi:hypothetical protein